MGGKPARPLEPPPPPGPAINPEESSGEEEILGAHQRSWRQQSLEQQLAATREELAAMKQLIEDLPEIFERRFALRMEPLLAHRERLFGEIRELRHHLLQLQAEHPPLSLPGLPPAQPRQAGLGRALKHAFGLRRSA
jgi:hypothetical protein